ncbi:prolyl-tRNA synthetase associated domain-containing protein 1-like [Lineus longissimus]|uniref:prolyl-tRNA synthetase associated domain-containing protein 1-like n=1 Tax=Lineus longissimus TaxID=88925 RepID=UPI002B4D8126
MANNHLKKEDLLAKFKEWEIESETVDHPEVFTVEAMMPYLERLSGAMCKNLFLKDKKKRLYLLAALFDREVKLSDVGKKVGATGGLRLADESILEEKLGVKQGCVTAYALVNDVNKDVKLLVDDDIINGKYDKVWFHPLDNAATTGVTCDDFLKFLQKTGHEPVSVKFE